MKRKMRTVKAFHYEAAGKILTMPIDTHCTSTGDWVGLITSRLIPAHFPHINRTLAVPYTWVALESETVGD